MTTYSPTGPAAALAEVLAERYRFERELGAGGMARVYLAEDLKHHRHVAIKVLRPELTAGFGVERFLKEIEIAAGLRHPHILPLYDSGSEAGLLYYVMPFVDGESLRERLDRTAPLPVDDAIRFSREIADALAYAHAHGIIHRDVKPDNVLLESGHAVVADFGIARAISLATADGTHNRLTATGVSLGTPAYMSPEQAAGDRDVDGRSDEYSLACVTYEMLAGSPPFTGSTAANLIHQHMVSEPRALTTVRAGVPPGVTFAVSRALAKNPADRFETVADFAKALSSPEGGVSTRRGAPRLRIRVLLGAAVMAALLAVAWATRRAIGDRATSSSNATNTAALDQKYVVAIMPFRNLSPDSSQAYLANGIAEEITTELSRISALRVLSRSAIAPVIAAPDYLQRLAKELGVGSVVEGSVSVQGDSAYVTMRLTDARSGDVLWTDDRNHDMGDALSVETQLARSMAAALQARLTPAEARRRGRPPTVKLEAYELYLRAARLSSFNPSQNRDAMTMLRQAIALDSAFARAHWALAARYLFLAYGRGPVFIDSGMVEARAAIAADPDLAQAYSALAGLQSYGGHYTAARASYLKALERNPSLQGAMLDLGLNEDYAGHYDESLYWSLRGFVFTPNSATAYYHVEGPLLRFENDAANERYIQHSVAQFPNNVRLQLNVARLDILRGRDSAAMELARRVLERNPSNQEARYFVAELATVTNAPDALTFVEPLVRESPEGRGDFLAESYRTQLGRLLAARGERARADSLWDAAAAFAKQQRAAGHEGSQMPLELAAISLVRGDTASALALVEEAYNAGWKDARILARDPFFDGLRQHPRFRATVARMRAANEAMRQRAAAAHPELFAPSPNR